MKPVVWQGVWAKLFKGAFSKEENALEVLLQQLHPLDAENNIASSLTMGKI